ncbi:B-cell receptor CD22-like [Mustelus asterias]
MAMLTSLLFLLFASSELTLTLILAEDSIDSIPGTSVYFLMKKNTSGFLSMTWKVNASTTIVLATGGLTTYFGAYKERAELFINNATLRLDHVTHGDSGLYALDIIPISGQMQQAAIRLRIYTPISAVRVSISPEKDIFIQDVDSVTLKCAAVGTEPNYSWIVAGQPLPENPRYKLSADNASLSIHSVHTNDSKGFICSVRNPVSSVQSMPVILKILASVSNVIVAISPVSDGLVEDEDNVSLKCDAQGTAPAYSWSHSGKPLLENPRFTLSADHSALVIKPVKRSDSNEFICKATNALNSQHSEPVKLRIYYGPDSAQTNVTAGKCGSTYTGGFCVKNGSEVSLMCQAQSFPECNYTWSFNGITVSSETVHVIRNAEFNNTGNYRCLAENIYTKKMGDSEISILVYRPPVGEIACDAEGREDQLSLSCSWADGIPPTAIEMKVGSTTQTGLNKLNYTIAKPGNKLPIVLQCKGQHVMSTETCRKILDEPQLFAPTGSQITVVPNENVSLKVSQTERAKFSNPFLPATFTWSKAELSTIQSGTKFIVNSNDTFSELVIKSLEKADEGTYTCLAKNMIGQKAFQFEVNFANELNVGLIVGATFGTLAGVVIISLVITFCIRRNKKRDVLPDVSREVKTSDGSKSEGATDVEYAQITILKKPEHKAADATDPKAKVNKPTKTGAPEVIYAQVKTSKQEHKADSTDLYAQVDKNNASKNTVPSKFYEQEQTVNEEINNIFFEGAQPRLEIV